jgi:hypothetical protein
MLEATVTSIRAYIGRNLEIIAHMHNLVLTLIRMIVRIRGELETFLQRIFFFIKLFNACHVTECLIVIIFR